MPDSRVFADANAGRFDLLAFVPDYRVHLIHRERDLAARSRYARGGRGKTDQRAIVQSEHISRAAITEVDGWSGIDAASRLGAVE